MAIENRGPQLQAVGYILMSAAVVAVLLRCFVRVAIVKNFGFDDCCMLAAIVSFILFVTCALVGVHYGTGRHHWDLADDDIATAMMYWWLCYLWYCITMIASKISIGYFLLRITVRRRDVWTIHGVMAITVLTGIVFFFVTIFQCNPVSYFWNKDQPGTCVPVEVIIALTYLYSACSVICDFTFALLPLALIWKLNMDKKSKLALVPIMAMACVASSAVVVRFAFVKDFASPDFLYATVDIAIWSTTEQGLAITAGSLATLRPLFRVLGYKLGLSTQGPSVLKDSEAANASSMGGKLQNTNSSGKRLRGPFTLTTFMRSDDNDEHSVDCESASGGKYELETKPGGKRASFWQKKEKDNDSEEELTAKDSNNSCWNQDRIVKVSTFTIAEDRV